MGLLFDLRDKIDDIQVIQEKVIFIEEEIGTYFVYTKKGDRERVLHDYDRISALACILSDYVYQTDSLLEALAGTLAEEIEKALAGTLAEEIEKAPESVGALENGGTFKKSN